MNIGTWKYNRKLLEEYPSYLLKDDESVLSNSVTVANFDFLAALKPGDVMLEVGCGRSSFVKENLPDGVIWEGIDVAELDSSGRPTIASKIGSVAQIPFDSNYFDYVIANQSIEHWFEYSVKLEEAMEEILRVLKVGGVALINFPLHLHGHPWFVKGDIEKIRSLFNSGGLRLRSCTAFTSDDLPNYPAWRRCGFPDNYVVSIRDTRTAFVVEITAEKSSDIYDGLGKNKDLPFSVPKRRSSFYRAGYHGPYVLAWRLFRGIKIRLF